MRAWLESDWNAIRNGTESWVLLPLWQPDRQEAAALLLEVLGGAEDGVYGSVDAHSVSVDHQVVLADVGPLAAGVAAVVVGTA